MRSYRSQLQRGDRIGGGGVSGAEGEILEVGGLWPWRGERHDEGKREGPGKEEDVSLLPLQPA